MSLPEWRFTRVQVVAAVPHRVNLATGAITMAWLRLRQVPMTERASVPCLGSQRADHVLWLAGHVLWLAGSLALASTRTACGALCLCIRHVWQCVYGWCCEHAVHAYVIAMQALATMRPSIHCVDVLDRVA